MKRMVRPFAALLAVLLLLGAAGCADGKTSWVYEYEGDQMPAGVYINFLMTGFTDAVSLLQEKEAEEMETMTAEELADYTAIGSLQAKDMYKLEVEGISFSDWVTRSAQTQARQYYAAQKKLDELGLELSGDEISEAELLAQATMENQYYGPFYQKNGIAESSLFLSYRNEVVQNTLFMHLYGQGGAYEIPEKEITDYLAETFVKGQYIRFPKEIAISLDEDSEEDEDDEDINAELRQTVQQYLEQAIAGEAMEELEYQWQLSQIDPEDTEEIAALEKLEEGDMDVIYTRQSGAAAVLRDGLFDAAPGVPQMLEDDNYFYLINRLDILTHDPEDLENYRESIMRELYYEDFQDKLTEWAQEITLTANEASLKRYTPEKLNFSN